MCFFFSFFTGHLFWSVIFSRNLEGQQPGDCVDFRYTPQRPLTWQWKRRSLKRVGTQPWKLRMTVKLFGVLNSKNIFITLVFFHCRVRSLGMYQNAPDTLHGCCRLQPMISNVPLGLGSFNWEDWWRLVEQKHRVVDIKGPVMCFGVLYMSSTWVIAVVNDLNSSKFTLLFFIVWSALERCNLFIYPMIVTSTSGPLQDLWCWPVFMPWYVDLSISHNNRIFWQTKYLV